MARCTNHPGRQSVDVIFGKEYCAECKNGIIAARKAVDRHVEPKDCFIWYVGNNNWKPISGTGCAHWVAHQLEICQGRAGDQCLAGYTYRVPVLITGRKLIANVADVQVNDIYVTPARDHTGLVKRVTPSKEAGGQPSILIQHDSSGQHRVAENDFATYFHGHGAFYR